jgi:ATP-dependent exoDNAse (exonuclease V) alpha subunit
MYRIDCRLKEIFANDKPFGGLSLVLMGDFAQLQPIGDKALYAPIDARLTSVQELAGYAVYKKFTSVLCLSRSMRQNGCQNLRKILDQMGKGPFDPKGEEIKLLQSRDIKKVDRHLFRKATYLCAEKKDYKQFNSDKLKALDAPKVVIDSQNEPSCAKRVISDKAGGLHSSITVCRGSDVLLTSNVCVQLGLTNGTPGRVMGCVFFTENEKEIPVVLVNFPSYTGTQGCLDQERFGPNKVFPVMPITREWQGTPTATWSRTMVPLMPAYGMSIHKAQGQTLDKVMLNLAKQERSGGLSYTGFSRVQTLDDLAFWPMPSIERLNAFSRKINYTHVKADMVAKRIMWLATLREAGLPIPNELLEPEQ